VRQTAGVVFDAAELFGVDEYDEPRLRFDRHNGMTEAERLGSKAAVAHGSMVLHNDMIIKVGYNFGRRCSMIVTTLEYIPGREIVEHFGVVSGSTVRAKHVGRDIAASLKNILGGELKGYTELLSEARDEAVARMKAQAESLGANAILNVRFSTSSVAAGAAELYVYGTAVRIA
jgi:uncharacterized protein YbjQ (UPF0145 family)